ncbi:MAG TPA: glucosamine-6-phosphate deaminase [Candidatus Sumerlaeota bacterium]|nr:MAG: Glucosamine-6-phosphate deaminase [candidate division BRC1 bacterium ADurb.Bin183]HOE62393.1 glucosamine-6-phosphate deaminase [Candidatus Sumerlaeota bacterium]HRR32241.1 glucosamine-6-phosphate deaminase [Candidatus Sumerlaeia bacterium]HON50166.1 glucosamine-6-phosphate deaminase [Candidatus Sumerlaeota bacterium]HOR63382.1 glucosamine-6-phosphate deaminase [Candidatus Sumerlaeota bacterium]
MPFTVIITKDYAHMSEEAGKIVLKELKSFKPAKQKKNYVLGLATGSTPVGLYQHLIDNQEKFNSADVISFNLDEYVGLPGENAQLRTLHPESYSYFMIKKLFGKLKTPFAKTYVPFGTLICQEELIAALKKSKDDFEIKGSDKGKAVVIKASAKNPLLKMIKKDILDAYEKSIAKAGGIDLQIIGVGGRGHVAFHESGIPLNHKMLLVKLDDNTIQNAVKDGHFATVEDSPNYAISLGAALVYKAKTVMLLANGERKIRPVAESILGPVTADVPISYGQKFSADGGNMIYILDVIAASGLKGKEKELKAKGIKVIDKTK